MGAPDTSMGGGFARMPTTQWGDFLGLGAGTPEYREFLDHWTARFWRPIYRYIRVSWGRSNEDAKDLTQEFLLDLIQRDPFPELRPELGSLRGYVKTALRHFLQNEKRDQGRQKRGGDVKLVSIEGGAVQGLEPGVPDRAGEEFDREWGRELLHESLSDLRQRCEQAGRPRDYDVFRAYYSLDDLEGAAPAAEEPAPRIGYAEVARRTGLTESDVHHALDRTRSILRQILRGRVRPMVASDSEADTELRVLFGV